MKVGDSQRGKELVVRSFEPPVQANGGSPEVADDYEGAMKRRPRLSS